MIIFLWKQHCEMTSENNKKRSGVRDESQGKVSSERRLWSAVDESGDFDTNPVVRVNWQSQPHHRLRDGGKQPWFTQKSLSQRFGFTRLQPQSQPVRHLTSQASSPESVCKMAAFFRYVFTKSVCHYKLEREMLERFCPALLSNQESTNMNCRKDINVIITLKTNQNTWAIPLN